LNFLRGRLDISGISKDAYSSVFGADGELKEDMKKRKFALTREQDPDLVYFLFNLEDPILGKYKTLRQAISQAINRREMIRLFYNDRAVAAQGPVGPGLFGYDPDLRDPWSYNLEEAKKAKAKSLEEYRKDTGRNEFPPIEFDGVADSTHRQWFELIASDLKQIGLKMESRIGTWPQLQARISRRQIQFTGAAWGADYPDAENFLQLLYGKNVSPGPNNANFKNAVYDRLYDQMRDLPDGPERLEIIKKMVRIIHEEIPWVFFAHRIAHGLRQGWVRNFKRNSFSPGAYKYIDIDSNEKRETLPLLQ
ncbi:MAG TPA: ABC transporter substrate-binding protein, partial [Bdellovibrionota bacterium]|nr:ABC transporter substrate-binding protein [Bdellovibrionota bacterium]